MTVPNCGTHHQTRSPSSRTAPHRQTTWASASRAARPLGWSAAPANWCTDVGVGHQTTAADAVGNQRQAAPQHRDPAAHLGCDIASGWRSTNVASMAAAHCQLLRLRTVRAPRPGKSVACCTADVGCRIVITSVGLSSSVVSSGADCSTSAAGIFQAGCEAYPGVDDGQC
jgi:hypothetical protein